MLRKLLKNYAQSLEIIREAKDNYSKLAALWAGGKDSTLMLYLIKEAFMNSFPFKVYFINTSFQFRETLDFLRQVSSLWKVPLEHIQNREALMKGCSPWSKTKLECCTLLKTEVIRQLVEKEGLEALLVAIRWDEMELRGKEYFISKRDLPEHDRVHPILHWSLEEVWSFTKLYRLPVNPLYEREVDGKVYKSIGCWTCTEPVPKESEERAGRRQEEVMERLRALGYL